MTAIVVNLATGAVTEYDWSFQSATATRAGGAAGLATLGGDDDNGAPIDAHFLSGIEAGETMTGVQALFVTTSRGDGSGSLIVQGEAASWEYPVAVRAKDTSRAKPGKGIRETRVGFGFRNAAGSDFAIDNIDAVTVASPHRRT